MGKRFLTLFSVVAVSCAALFAQSGKSCETAVAYTSAGLDIEVSSPIWISCSLDEVCSRGLNAYWYSDDSIYVDPFVECQMPLTMLAQMIHPMGAYALDPQEVTQQVSKNLSMIEALLGQKVNNLQVEFTPKTSGRLIVLPYGQTPPDLVIENKTERIVLCEGESYQIGDQSYNYSTTVPVTERTVVDGVTSIVYTSYEIRVTPAVVYDTLEVFALPTLYEKTEIPEFIETLGDYVFTTQVGNCPQTVYLHVKELDALPSVEQIGLQIVPNRWQAGQEGLITADSPMDISVYSLQGALLATEQQVQAFRFTPQSSGVYLLQVASQGRRHQLRLLVF